MKFIVTSFFLSKLKELSKKYQNISNDFSDFKKQFNINHATDLWWWIFKYRWKNTSIPVGKRWGLRFIVKIHNNIVLPILVYSKTMKGNVTEKETIVALEIIEKELK